MMMSIDRAKQILSSYGGQVEQWPEYERESLQTLLQDNPGLQALQQQQLQLDHQLLGLYSLPTTAETELLAQQTLQVLPPQSVKPICTKTWKNELIDLFMPHPVAWTTALASLVMVIMIGFIQNPVKPTKDTLLTTPNTADIWLMMTYDLLPVDDLELIAVLEPELWDDIEAI